MPHIAKFIGRDLEISQLQGLLPSADPKRRKVFVLYGLGGIGKIQLAIEFARRYKDSFTAIFWLSGKNRETLIRSFASIAKRLPHAEKLISATDDVKNIEEMEKKAREILKWFTIKGNSKWLLIFDNIDKDETSGIEDKETYNVEEFFPGADHGSIVITTRLKHLKELGKSIPVGILDEEEALEVLAEITGPIILQDNCNNWISGEIKSCQTLVLNFCC